MRPHPSTHQEEERDKGAAAAAEAGGSRGAEDARNPNLPLLEGAFYQLRLWGSGSSSSSSMCSSQCITNASDASPSTFA